MDMQNLTIVLHVYVLYITNICDMSNQIRVYSLIHTHNYNQWKERNNMGANYQVTLTKKRGRIRIVLNEAYLSVWKNR